jgi:dienelactone hydrolase
MRTLLFPLLLLVTSLCQAADEPLTATLNESVFKLATTVRDVRDRQVTGQMTVTQFKPDGAGPFPIAVLLHGRALDISQPARHRYVEAARYFVQRGFVVLVPTRLGYGDASASGADPEDAGNCANKQYGAAFEAAASSTMDVIGYAKKLPFADPTRVVVLGQSFGGAAALAVAAKRPDGLRATINFAGGAGGSPGTRPGAPCRPDKIEVLYAGYGATTRTPSLWLYTQNDLSMGTREPKNWFAAYQKTGGAGTFAALPAFGDDGHRLFMDGIAQWRPLVDQFLQSAGFTIDDHLQRKQ